MMLKAGAEVSYVPWCPGHDCYGLCETIDYPITKEHRIYASMSLMTYNSDEQDYLDNYGNYAFLDEAGDVQDMTEDKASYKLVHSKYYVNNEGESDSSPELLIYQRLDSPSVYVVCFRGTFALRDVTTDAILGAGNLVNSDRYLRTKQQVEDYFDDVAVISQLFFTGHSLGGGLAVELHHLFKDNYQSEVIIFNAAYTCAHPGSPDWEITSYRATGDAISMLGIGQYKKEVTVSQKYLDDTGVDNVLKAHSMNIFVKCPEGFDGTHVKLDGTAIKQGSEAVPICRPPGCTDEEAENYDSNARTSDESVCYYAGCTDKEALNYNPRAVISQDVCLYMPVKTLGWLNSKSVDPEKDELNEDDYQVIRKLSLENIEALDTNIIRHSEKPDLQLVSPANRYNRFEYPTEEIFTIMVNLYKDHCLYYSLGLPRRHKRSFSFHYWNKENGFDKAMKGYSVNRVFSGVKDLAKKDIKENEIWCDLPYNGTEYPVRDHEDDEFVIAYGNDETPRASVARILKEIEIYSNGKKPETCQEWNNVASYGFSYATMSGECEDYGWDTPFEYECQREGGINYQHSMYQDEAPDLLDYHQNDNLWKGTDLVNHFDLDAFYTISVYGETLKDYLDENAWADAEDIHNELERIFCRDSLRKDCTWKQYYVPSEHIDTYSPWTTDSDMMKWWQNYEQQPLYYICGNKIYYSKYQKEAPDLEYYYNNDNLWKGTDLLNHFDLFGFYTITMDGKTLKDYIDENPWADAMDIHNYLKSAFCSNTIQEDCTWKQYYVPFRFIDHYSRSVGDWTNISPKVDVSSPSYMCKRDLRTAKDSLNAVETSNMNELQEKIVQGQVALRTWADQECGGSDLCLFGAKDIEKQDRGFAVPLIIVPVDIGFSHVTLELQGFTLVYSKQTKMSYCYDIHQEGAVMIGAKAAASPLAFSGTVGSVSALKNKATKKIGGATSKLARRWLRQAKQRIYKIKFALGKAKYSRAMSDTVQSMNLPNFNPLKAADRKAWIRGDISDVQGMAYKSLTKKVGLNAGLLRMAQFAHGVSWAARTIGGGLAWVGSGVLKGLFNGAVFFAQKARVALAKIGMFLVDILARSIFYSQKGFRVIRAKRKVFGTWFLATAKRASRSLALEFRKWRFARNYAKQLSASKKKAFERLTALGEDLSHQAKKINGVSIAERKARGAMKKIQKAKRKANRLLPNRKAKYEMLRQRRMKFLKNGLNSPYTTIRRTGHVNNIQTTYATDASKLTTLRRLGKPPKVRAIMQSARTKLSDFRARWTRAKQQVTTTPTTARLATHRPGEQYGHSTIHALGLATQDGDIDAFIKASNRQMFKYKQLRSMEEMRAGYLEGLTYAVRMEHRTHVGRILNKEHEKVKLQTLLENSKYGRIRAQQRHASRRERGDDIIKATDFDEVFASYEMNEMKVITELNNITYNTWRKDMVEQSQTRKQARLLKVAHRFGGAKRRWAAYRRFLKQPGIQRTVGTVNNNDPPPLDQVTGLYPEDEARKHLFEIMQEIHLLGSVTIENYWYELGYCRNSPCPFNRKATGHSLDNDLTTVTKGKYGMYEWSSVSIEVTTFGTGVRGTAFRSTNFDSKTTAAGGTGWDRTLWNGQTMVYVPGAFDAMVYTSISGFLASFLNFALELGIGKGRMRWVEPPVVSVDGSSESINPVGLHVNICMSQNPAFSAEHLMTRPSEQSCEHTYVHRHKIRLNYPSVEKFINCPLTHFWKDGLCIAYDQSYFPPLIQVDEHYLMTKASQCYEDDCEISDSVLTLYSPYSSLRRDYNFVQQDPPDYLQVHDSYLYSIEDMGVRDTLNEHPYTGKPAYSYPISIISEEKCEMFGLSPIYALHETSNAHIKAFVENLYKNYNISMYDQFIVDYADGVGQIKKDVFGRKKIRPMFKQQYIVYDEDTIQLEDRVRSINTQFEYVKHTVTPFEHAYIPYGVSLVPEGGEDFKTNLHIVQKNKGYYGYNYENNYGRDPSFEPMCTDEYKCVCFKGDEYIYTTFDKKPNQTSDEYIYLYQPIMSMEECHVAATVIKNNITDYYDNIWYHNNWVTMDEEAVRLNRNLNTFGCMMELEYEHFIFNDKAYDLETKTGRTANFFANTNRATVIKVVRARNTAIRKEEKRIHVKLPVDILTEPQQDMFKENPIGRFIYSDGRALIPIERDFKPIKYKGVDMFADSPNNLYLHEITDTSDITTYRYMRQGETYSALNNGIIERIKSDGVINYNQLGEKENLISEQRDASISSSIGCEENWQVRPQVINEIIQGVENVYKHKFEHVGNLRTFAKPIFGNLDYDSDVDLFIADGGRVRHAYASDENLLYQLLDIDDFGLDDIDLGESITPAFANMDGGFGIDLITTHRITGKIKLYGNNYGTNFDVNDTYKYDPRFESVYGACAAVFPTTNTHNYYENTGSTSNPSYTSKGKPTPFDGVDIRTRSVHAFVDTDTDGDMDIVIGAKEGDLTYYENTGNANHSNYTRREGALNPFAAIDVGSSSVPAFVDLDNDGDMDLVIGRSVGDLIYYENTGNATHASYTRGEVNPFDGVDVESNSAPVFVDTDDDGDMDLVIGRWEGDLIYYENTGSPNNSYYTIGEVNPFVGITVEFSSVPAFVDTDSDGDMDLVVGGGDLQYYEDTGFMGYPSYTRRYGNPFDGGARADEFSVPAFVDIDNDGDMDLVVARSVGKTELLYISSGTWVDRICKIHGIAKIDTTMDIEGEDEAFCDELTLSWSVTGEDGLCEVKDYTESECNHLASKMENNCKGIENCLDAPVWDSGCVFDFDKADCYNFNAHWNVTGESACEIEGTVGNTIDIMEANKTFCDELTLSWEDGLCEVHDYTEWQCNSLASIMEDKCSINTYVIHDGYGIDDCIDFLPAWSLEKQRCIFSYEEDDCNNFDAKWSDSSCIKWDRHEFGIDDQTCANESPITCLDTTKEEGTSTCKIEGATISNVPYESCKRIEWTPKYCELWYDYTSEPILAETDNDCSQYNPVVKSYMYEEYSEIFDTEVWYHAVKCTLYNGTVRDFRDIPASVSNSEIVSWGTKQCENDKPTLIQSTCYDRTPRILTIVNDDPMVMDMISGGKLMGLKEQPGNPGAWEVTAVAFSPDGSKIVTGTVGGSVKVWDTASGSKLMDLVGHEAQKVVTVAFSPDGTKIVSSCGDMDNSIRVWDSSTGVELLVIFKGNIFKDGLQGENSKGHMRYGGAVSFSPDGSRIVSGSEDKVRMWSASSGAKIWERPENVVADSGNHHVIGTEIHFKSVSFSPDGSKVVTGSDDNTIRVWNSNTGDELLEIELTVEVNSVSFSPDGTRIVSGSNDNTVRVWDSSTGASLKNLTGHTGYITHVSFYLDESRILSGSLDNTVRLWDSHTGELLYSRETIKGMYSALPVRDKGEGLTRDECRAFNPEWSHPWETKKIDCMWGSANKYGDIVNFNNKAAINTGEKIELWDNGWTDLHDKGGHPAYYYDGTYLIGKQDTVEYFKADGTPYTQDNGGKKLVATDYIDVFKDGKLTGGGVNIHLTTIPCRALAISDTSYYLDKARVLNEIPTHEFLTRVMVSGDIIPPDTYINRVCGHLPNTPISNSISCTESHSFPNTCPEGYGLVHSKWENTVYNHATEYAIPFIRGSYTQCAECPGGKTSPDGHTRCLGDEFELDYTNLFIDEYEPTVFATHLQKYHHNKGNAYFPTIHSQDGIDYIDNEVYSDTKFLRCKSGYVPKLKGEIPDVTGSSDIKADVLAYYSGTCSGYTCQRCPVNFIEQKQRCVQCPPGMIAGWEYNRLQSNNGRAENSCFRVSVPKGHFMDVQNPAGVTIGTDSYPYTTHCDHWLYHPAGERGAYQDETNKYECKIADSGSKAVINLNTRVVTTWNTPGQKVSNDRTRAINCTDYEVCNGEEIIGCKPGYIWYRQTNDREDEECVKCNEDGNVYDLHPEKDDYEYCDGTHKSQCDLGTHTYGDILDGKYAERYVGIRDTWRGSNLVRYTSQPSESIYGSKQYIYRPDWDIEKARIQADLPWVTNVAHAGEVSALANRGDTVVSGGRSYDGGQALKLWNKQTGTYIALNGQSGSINSVDIAPDGTIVSASSDGSVAMWSSLGNLIWTTTHHGENIFGNREVNSVAFSPDGTEIVSGGSDGSVIVQDIAGELVQTLNHSEPHSYENVTDENVTVTVHTTVPAEVYAVAWGNFIVSGGKDCLRKWDLGDGSSTCLIDVPYVSSVVIKGSTVIAAARETIYINNISTNITASSNVYALAFSPNGQYFVSVGDDIQIWNIDRTLRRQMPPSRYRDNIEAYGHGIYGYQGIRSVAWGAEIITGGKDKTIRVWKDWDQYNRTHVRLSMVDWHGQSKCLPVPNDYFALDKEWKLHSCGYAKEHCIHRTFHRIYPFIYPTVSAPKYMFTQAVRETSYDEIFRFTDRQCLDGYLKDGCLKEYCSREGQTNCWCGEEEDFCTMACVDGMCVPACSEQVCDPDYEICLGVGDSGRCARVCVGPSDNFCVTDEGGVKVCRHYNEDWNSTRLQSLEPQPDSPCFSYMPNIPETQCKDVFDNECFCNREFLDDEHNTCLDKIIEPRCSEPQDDGTCTYLPQENLDKRDCVCGNELTEQTCYQKEGKCGVHASLQRSCTELLSTIQNTRTHGIDTQCRPTGEENIINPDQCRLATDIKKSFGSWDIFNESLTCNGTESFEPGCIDPHADNYNQYAVIPKQCEYI